MLNYVINIVSQSLFRTEDTANRIQAISPSGFVSTLAGSGALLLFGLLIHDDVLYVTERDGRRIRRVTMNGNVTTLAGNVSSVVGSNDGQGAAPSFYLPSGIKVDKAGNLYVRD